MPNHNGDPLGISFNNVLDQDCDCVTLCKNYSRAAPEFLSQYHIPLISDCRLICLTDSCMSHKAPEFLSQYLMPLSDCRLMCLTDSCISHKVPELLLFMYSYIYMLADIRGSRAAKYHTMCCVNYARTTPQRRQDKGGGGKIGRIMCDSLCCVIPKSAFPIDHPNRPVLLGLDRPDGLNGSGLLGTLYSLQCNYFDSWKM